MVHKNTAELKAEGLLRIKLLDLFDIWDLDHSGLLGRIHVF